MRRVHRRSSLTPTVAIALALAGLAAGCSDVSNSDAVARVNGVELSQDELNTKLADLGATSGEALPLEPVRAEIGRWIRAELLTDVDIASIYDAGPVETGVLCVSVTVIADQIGAEAGLGELESGTDFVELFNATNLDQSLVATSGALPCITVADLEANAATPSVSVAGTLSADAPFGIAPVLDETGGEAAWVVIAFRPFADLEPAAVEEVTAQLDVSIAGVDGDVFVASRYGTFDPATGQVVGLG